MKVHNKKVTTAVFLHYKMCQEILIALRFQGQVQTSLEEFQ